MNQKSILIAAGGTGGHISPGIALYEELKEIGARVIFLVGKRDYRFSSLDDVLPDDLKSYRAPTVTKNVFKLSLFIFKFVASLLSSRKIIKKYNVGAVIGMGGYVSAPALLAARFMKLPIFLCEQNSIPGRVTRFFEKHAMTIYGTFEISREYLKFGDKFIHAGNPIRKKVIVNSSKEEAKKAFHLSHNKQVILAIGGSQGALRINELIFGLKKNYSEDFKNIGIIWSTGQYSYNRYKEKIHNEMDEGSIYLSPFITRVGLAYRASDIAIARSGAGVMMELAAMGVPSVQIPYPYAAMNHQDKNADEFVKAGAAIKVNDEDALPEKFIDPLLELLNNSRSLKKMSDKARSISMEDASSVIAKDIVDKIGLMNLVDITR